MFTVWRLVPAHRATTAFDGEGARLFGGRWNSSGVRVVYTSENRSLAALEVLVHLTPATIHRLFSMIGVRIPEELIEVVPVRKLPSNWNALMISTENHAFGDEWIRSERSAVLKLPSTVISAESNYLLNPQHPDFARLQLEPPEDFSFDPRLITFPR
jgi:RES domain-containing protein